MDQPVSMTDGRQAAPAFGGIVAFNLFSLKIVERLQGRKLVTLLAERTGTTERTWRNRFKHNWSPLPVDAGAFRERSAAYIVDQLKTVEGLSAEEAQSVIARNPSWKAGHGLPTADLVFWFSPGYGEDYPEAISTAGQFDLHSYAIHDAFKTADIDSARLALQGALKWLRSYCSADEDMSDADTLAEHLQEANDLSALYERAAFLAEQMLFHVMSCWDVEFCARYFPALVEPYPLFGLVMPRLSPGIVIEQAGGRFLRNGQVPKQRLFEKSVARLFDFLAVLIYWRRHRRFPDRIPQVKEMAAWFAQHDARIISWRDETTRFTANNLFTIWKKAVGSDKEGVCIGAPLPMLVAAHLWSPVLVLEAGKPRQWISCADGYERWWKRNLSRLAAKGLHFGATPWPECLTGHPEGGRLLAEGYLPPDLP
ncbi:MAG TPA: hypothetical protein VJ577_08470 [Burkholderiaceae bacterium]|nr:hypothetical protein [Burkholderiaceae bacterium]